MSSENIEQQMEFIVDQQAKFSADIAALTASAAKHDEQISNLADALLRLANIVEQQSTEIADLIRHSKEVDRRFEQTDRRFEETDARLNALILAVERFISSQG